VKRIPSMKLTDIARAIAPEARHEIVGVRPGEKLHEQMIGAEDALYTYEYAAHFKVLPAIHNWSADPMRIQDGAKVSEAFVYTSDSNAEWMSIEALRAWIAIHRPKIGQV
jgi:FlaA1/EpsC-like NDP-sugar epimerase